MGIFLVIGLLMIKSQLNTDLSDNADRRGFLEASLAWMSTVAQNAVSVIGYSVSLDWLPENKSNERTTEHG